MELKLPPAFVFIFFGSFMYLLARFMPIGEFDFFGKNYLMLALCAAALLIGIISLVQFFAKKTSIDPRSPAKASKLVQNGLYAYSRNPMYLALLLLLLAWGLWLENAFNTLLAAGFVAYMNRFQIIPEETFLLDKFGDVYKKYCIAVRRWF
ncbi:MAG: isoprenylcysteine carboxylmethyltransferase family protein [Flavobacteriaceae bacterium]